MGRVLIGTCLGPAEAALVRAAFDAHGIPIVINAEQHASVLGGLGALVPLHVYASDEHAEEAAALLNDLRDHDHDREEIEAEMAEEAEEAGQADAGDAREDPKVWRRRRAVGVILLGCFLTFGTAHMSTGAWLRGMALAGLEVLAITYLRAGEVAFGGGLIFLCIGMDVAGALLRVASSTPPASGARAARER